MEEKKHNGWGGKREGAGRPSGTTQKLISVKMDLDLLESMPDGTNKNGYINDSVREKMIRDGIKVSNKKHLKTK